MGYSAILIPGNIRGGEGFLHNTTGPNLSFLQIIR